MTTVRYQVYEDIDHILARPDMYVGSKRKEEVEDYVYKLVPDEEGYINGQLVKTYINISPAFIRTFQEILSNALDNLERKSSKPMSFIDIDINQSYISIMNDGAVIPILKNEDDIYFHTLIFGYLRSGSNYDDNEDRFTAGRNGLGAKLTNVLSTKFIVEGVDPQQKLKFVQTWTNNMRNTDGPIITKSSSVTGYTKITWFPDLKWFNMPVIKNDIIEYMSVFCLYASITAGASVSKNVKVKLSIPSSITGTVAKKCEALKIELPNKFEKFFDLMSNTDSCVEELLKLQDEHSKVLVTSSMDGFEAFSFVNGIKTKNGGRHVTAWIDAVLKPVVVKLNGTGKNTGSKLTIKDVKPFFRFLIVSRVVNPEFDSQEKNELKTPVSATTITPAQVKKILSWSIKDSLKNLTDKKERKIVAKTLATQSKIVIEGYDKANNAGKKNSHDCSLIVCEGLSAKTFCVEGITNGIPGLPGKGRDYYGIYPLKGKLLNTQNANPTVISKNTVITDLMRILGLEYDKPFKPEKLNYGRVIILTDADVDGIHIEGLLLNFFHTLFPCALKNTTNKNPFILSMKTPLVKIGKDIYFFDDRAWKKYTVANDLSKIKNIKYHKGLGTIKQVEVKNVFGKKMITFVKDNKTDDAFKVAFGKDFSDNRKKLLARFSSLQDSDKYLSLDDTTQTHIVYSLTDFLNTELPKFHHEDCKRSLPSAIDGLKESQRKIVYTAKLRNLQSKSEPIKVAQFAAAVAENTAYHHGEQNLANTIINLAQSFVGSNNLPLFTEDGMFGTRLEGGKDAASPRYIYTKCARYFSTLFPEEDDNLLLRREDDGITIEPYYYVPTIPILLVNGAMGIGTGWSCFCPCFNPQDILHACSLWMENNKEFTTYVKRLTPWYKDFKGTITSLDEKYTKFITRGLIKQTQKNITVTELPIGEWTSSFVRWLDEQHIDFNNRSTPQDVLVEIKNDANIKDVEKKITSRLSLDNIVVFDQKEDINQVNVVDIFNIWGVEKLKVLELRKAAKLEKMQQDQKTCTIKREFIIQVKTKKIDLTVETNKIIEKIKKITTEDVYQKMLLDMNIRSLTLEKSKELSDKIDRLDKEIKILSKTTTREMWFEDVKQFVLALKSISE